MSKKLTRTQLNILNKLVNDLDLKCDRLLRRYIWANTTEPKYKVGDDVVFDDIHTFHFGQRVENFKGTVIKVEFDTLECKIIYHIEYKFKKADNEKVHTSVAYRQEYSIKHKTTHTKMVNVLNKITDDCAEAINL